MKKCCDVIGKIEFLAQDQTVNRAYYEGVARTTVLLPQYACTLSLIHFPVLY